MNRYGMGGLSGDDSLPCPDHLLLQPGHICDALSQTLQK
jgi:hypothetical protein